MLRNTHSNTLLAMLRQVSLSVNFTSIPEIVRTRYLGILAAGNSVLCCPPPSARSNSLKTVRTLASKTLGTYVSPARASLSKDVSQRIQKNSRTSLASSLPVLLLGYDSKKLLILCTNLFSSVKLHSHSTRDFQFSFRKCWRVRFIASPVGRNLVRPSIRCSILACAQAYICAHAKSNHAQKSPSVSKETPCQACLGSSAR